MPICESIYYFIHKLQSVMSNPILISINNKKRTKNNWLIDTELSQQTMCLFGHEKLYTIE